MEFPRSPPALQNSTEISRVKYQIISVSPSYLLRRFSWNPPFFHANPDSSPWEDPKENFHHIPISERLFSWERLSLLWIFFFHPMDPVILWLIMFLSVCVGLWQLRAAISSPCTAPNWHHHTIWYIYFIPVWSYFPPHVPFHSAVIFLKMYFKNQHKFIHANFSYF